MMHACKRHKIDFEILIIIQINGNKYGYKASTTSLNIYYVRYIKIQSTDNQNFCLRIELCGEGKPYYTTPFLSFAFLIYIGLRLMDLLPNEQNFDLDKSRQKFHHSLKEHHKISNIPKFRCEML
jgi:hypothetical protein